jgi:hypothetical protein
MTIGDSLGSCVGQRIDGLAKNEFMTASKCISLFGTCCGTESSPIDKGIIQIFSFLGIPFSLFI